ncbi:YhcH/YjgK/YiaL family protein [Mesomycoplasma hyorhinis]|uniref:YhcH/YjgK/YiaL family protein n=1 Tax=Mesomycoplasma hyorhinis TaxID=2100 RepID=UPI001C04B7A0|nr:YhcH/YjgK/YiaL family protein [Mesomycoplasma hyorhinis]
MIIDKIKNLHKYTKINPRLELVVKWLEENDWRKQPEGITPIKEKEVFFVNKLMSSLSRENFVFELHQKYIDIHFAGDNTEKFIHLAKDHLTSAQQEYSDQTDVGFYKGDILNFEDNIIKLKEDEFALFLADEAHGPRFDTNKDTVRKTIIKVLA